MKKLFISCVFLFCVDIAFANSSTTCRNVAGSIYCDTYNYGTMYGTPTNYGPNLGDSILSGIKTGMQFRKDTIDTQNAILQQYMLFNQAQQAASSQKKISSCKIDKIIGKEFPIGRIELVLTWITRDTYQIDDTEAYVITKDCFRYMHKQTVLADITDSSDDRIYFE